MTPYLLSHGLRLVLPLNRISDYYGHSFTTCHFDPKRKRLSVVLQVPFERQNRIAKVFETTAIQFLYKDEFCSLAHANTLIVMVNEHPIVLEDNQLHHCKVHDGICFFQELSTSLTMGTHCISSLYHGASLHDLIKTCPFNCRPRVGLKDINS